MPVFKGQCPVCKKWITLVAGYIVQHGPTPNELCPGGLRGAEIIKQVGDD